MVKIRLKRGGAKRRPYYRVIAIDSRAKRDGRALEYLGTYNPVTDPAEIRLETEKIEAWVARGAQLAPSVKALIKRARKQGTTAAPVAPTNATAAAAGAAQAAGSAEGSV